MLPKFAEVAGVKQFDLMEIQSHKAGPLGQAAHALAGNGVHLGNVLTILATAFSCIELLTPNSATETPKPCPAERIPKPKGNKKDGHFFEAQLDGSVFKYLYVKDRFKSSGIHVFLCKSSGIHFFCVRLWE